MYWLCMYAFENVVSSQTCLHQFLMPIEANEKYLLAVKIL